MAEPMANAIPVKEHRMLNGEAEYDAGVDEVIIRAQKTLHLFDADLKHGGFSSVQRFEAIRDFLLRGRSNQLVIILHETDFLTTRCPRLMNLLKTHGHNIHILKTHEHARGAGDPFIVADEMHYLHRFHQDDPRSLLAFNDHAGARQLEERFAQLLEASHPAVFATTLGL